MKKYNFNTARGGRYQVEAKNKREAKQIFVTHLEGIELPSNLELILQDKNNGDVSFGQHAADKVTALLGSWSFILTQSFLIITWIVLNILGINTQRWDPYPFICLNLLLSLQAAYAAPIIMMSQNRQANKDRQHMYNDSKVGKATLIIDKQNHDNIAEIKYLLVDYQDDMNKRLQKIEKHLKNNRKNKDE